MRFAAQTMVVWAVVKMRQKVEKQRLAADGPAAPESMWGQLDLEPPTIEPEPESEPQHNAALAYKSSAEVHLSDKPAIDRKHFRKIRKSVRFKRLIDRFWMAMAGDDHLSPKSCTYYPQYADVHIRISKTLSPPGTFVLAEAKDVAREDFDSDTYGGDSMSKHQLTESIYELAIVWTGEVLEKAGVVVTDIHYCILLESIFDNIAVNVSAR